MASKLARKIAQLLVAHECVLAYKIPNLLDIIDRTIKDQSISKKEVARLQENERILGSAIGANNDLLQTNSDLKRELAITDREADCLAKWLVAEKFKTEKLKAKLWNAEQEIHDLKYEREKQNEYVEHLEITNRTLCISPFLWKWGWESVPTPELKICSNPSHIHDWWSGPECDTPLIPPPCLKPLDAMKWSEQTMFASEVR